MAFVEEEHDFEELKMNFQEDIQHYETGLNSNSLGCKMMHPFYI